MEKWDARLFLSENGTNANTELRRNIVELESRRQLRQKINELIRLSSCNTITTGEILQYLHFHVAFFGEQFSTQLVRSLQRDDQSERHAVVWLLTLLDERTTIPQLQQLSRNPHIPRPVRLSASLALAGMNATSEVTDNYRHTHLYAIS